jgi:dipeptidyl-peptidase-4
MNRSRWRLLVVAVALISITSSALASEELTKTLDRIFNSKEFDAKKFGPARWVDGGSAYTTVEPSFAKADAKDAPKDIVRYETASGKREVLVSSAKLTPAGVSKPLTVDDYAWSKDGKRLLVFTNTRKVWRRNTRGDYWVLDQESGTLRKLGGAAPTSTLMFAKFSPDGSRVAYVRENNIYVEDLTTRDIRQITSRSSEAVINGTSDWVYEEEFNVRDGFRWSPDGRSIAYWQFDTSGVQEFSLVNYTDSLYPVLTRFPYPKVGTTNSAARIGVVSASGGDTRWMDVPGDSRDNYIARMEWAGNSNQLVLEQLNRLQNTNDLLLANAQTGQVRRVFRDRDDSWVDVVEDIRSTDDGQQFLWLSERDGWRHAYAIARADGSARLVTQEPADVIDLLGADQKGEWVYYIASPNNPTERYLYRARLDGSGTAERLTPASAAGTHDYSISPDGQWALHTFSTFDQPPVTELVKLPGHAVVRVLEQNADLRSKAAPLIEPVEFFHVDSGDGATLDGWMIKPHGFDASKKYPVLVYVYGEPADVTVTNVWHGERSLFHRAFANDGYIVISIDNRGTPAPKGREWRKIIYGSVGVLSSQEQAAALRNLLATRPYLDSDRVAVWGWSGGGSNTLNLMFRSPGLYKVGVAVAPVPDQRYYDTIYQERYMGLPKQNPEGYRSGSPINFAEGLRGKLLLVHGSGDDNCHMQGSQLLINRLIGLGKPFDFMEYPNRTHAISEGDGTSFHIYSLIARYVEEHVPAGPRDLTSPR